MILFHSFRSGSGRTFIAANVAGLLALQGRRVGLVDANFNRPSIHHFVNLNEGEINHSLYDYLTGKCTILQAAVDVTGRLPAEIHPPLKENVAGSLFIVPGHTNFGAFSPVMNAQFGSFVAQGRSELVEGLKLDVLLVDVMDGWNEQTMMLAGVCKALVSVLKMDMQDYQFTASFIDSARELGVPQVVTVANLVPHGQKLERIEQQLRDTYHTPEAFAVPYASQVLENAGQGLFVYSRAENPVSLALGRLAHAVDAINERA